MTIITYLIAGFSIWLSGAWSQGERKASTFALIFAAIMLAIGRLS